MTSSVPSVEGDWELVSSKRYYYITGKKYRQGDRVTYNGDVYEYVSLISEDVIPSPSSIQWKIESYEDEILYWRNTNFLSGDKVLYNGFMYEAINDIYYSSDKDNIKYPNKGDTWRLVGNTALDWINGKGYFTGQKLVYNGLVYIDRRYTESVPNEDYDWKIEGNYPQYWMPKKGYKQGELVVYDGKVYKVVINNKGPILIINEEYWEIK